jgi:PST family polysaccharide transporter
MSKPSTDAVSADTNPDLCDLKRKSVSGGIVMLGSQGITVAVQLVSTVILARILTPEDYGTLAMVTAITAFAALFRDLGLSSAAIQKKGLTTAQQSNLFWLNVLAGTALTAVIAACAPLVARFYGKPELVNVTLVLSLSFIITSLGTQHGAMLVRRMQFGRSSCARIAGALATLGVSVVCGLKGYAYWSLVWGTLAGAIVTTLLLFLLSPFRPGLPNRGSGVRQLLGFGANVTAFNFVNYFSRNLDNILIGKFVGTDALGLYGRAYQLLMFPIINLRAPIQSVAFPAMSQLDPRSDEFRSYYCGMISLLALLTMPLMAWMFVAADGIIHVLLGPQWGAAVPVFSVLSIVGFIQPVTSMNGLVLLSSGESRRNLCAGTITALVVSLAFCVGVVWGAIGVAWAYAVVNWGMSIPMQVYSFKGTSIQLIDFLRACFLPLIASALAALFITLVEGVFEDFSVILTILLKGVFMLMVMIITLFLDEKLRRIIFSILRKMVLRL